MSRMTIDDVRAFVVPIRLRQLARQEGYCEVAVDVRLLADVLAVVDAARAAAFHWCFINPYQDIECLHCGETHDSEHAFPHAAECPYVALRDALTAMTRGEGDD